MLKQVRFTPVRTQELQVFQLQVQRPGLLVLTLHVVEDCSVLNKSNIPEILCHTPKSSSLPVVPFPRVVGADVTVILVTNAGLTQVPWVVSFGIMFWVLHSWDTAIAKKIPYRSYSQKNPLPHGESCTAHPH